jgi:hypothetical protein
MPAMATLPGTFAKSGGESGRFQTVPAHIPAAGVVFGYSKGSCFEDWYETAEESEEPFEKCREQVMSESQEGAEPD